MKLRANKQHGLQRAIGSLETGVSQQAELVANVCPPYRCLGLVSFSLLMGIANSSASLTLTSSPGAYKYGADAFKVEASLSLSGTHSEQS